MAPIAPKKEDFKPTEQQTTTLIIIGIYIVVILIFWNVKYLKTILWPFKVKYFIK